MSDERVAFLRQQVIDAFNGMPYPGKKISDHFEVKSKNDAVEMPDIWAYFKGRTWQECDGKSLHSESDALSWFTENGFCYWLPAYLLAELDGTQEIDTAIDFAIWRIAGVNSGNAQPRSLRPLSSAQFDALEAFLVYCIETSQESWEYPDYDKGLAEVRRQRDSLKR